jgi:hypothetical protein
VSKQITATCVALLQRDGVLSLGDDVREFVPELALREPVTLRQCAQHTGGLRDYLSLVDAVGAPLASVALEPDFLRLVAPLRETNFAPGTDISYSNTGYVLLAVVVGRATGGTFQRFAAERVFGPLGMHRSCFRDGLGFVLADLASSYQPIEGGGYRRDDLAEALVGDGAALTSVSDLARWQGFLLDGRGLGADIRDEIVSPAVLRGGRPTRYGLGIRLGRLDGHELLWHGGAMYGFRSALLCVPDEGLGVCVLTNHGDVDAEDLARRVASRTLGGHDEGPSAGSGADWPTPFDLAGRWIAAEADWQLTIRAESGGDLTVVSGDDEERYARRGPRAWAFGGYAVLEHRREDGDVLAWTDHAGRSVCLRRPEPGTAPVPTQVVGRYSSDELGIDLVISDDDGLSIELGDTGAHQMTYVAQDGDDALYEAGPATVRLTPGTDVVLLSAAGLQRLRFGRRPERDRR